MTKSFFVRLLMFVIGLFFMAFGVALSVKANLGTTPISSVPYVYSLKPPLSMGVITVLMHVVFILLQIALLRKNYSCFQLLQLPVALIFGLFTDVTLYLVSAHDFAGGYAAQWLLCAVSIVLVAFGVFLEVKAKVVYLAGEGACVAIARVFNVEFGKVKVAFDCSLVVFALVSSWFMFGSIRGIREGTIVSALLVGILARWYARKMTFMDAWLGGQVPAGRESVPVTESPAMRTVVTITREYGSGGHEIGEMVARKLGVPFYDSAMIEMSAAASGMSKEYVMEHEQKLAHRLLFELYEQNYAYVSEQMPPLDLLFMVQSKVIRDLEKKGSCVIVGRCADFVLKHDPACFSVFIHADKAYRSRRIVTEYGVDPAHADEVLAEADKDRGNYYKHYTHKSWGSAQNYQMTINSAAFGVEGAADMIVHALQARGTGAWANPVVLAGQASGSAGVSS